jgi:hypothetical protein
MRQPRRHFSADEKVKILRRHLIEHEPPNLDTQKVSAY